MWAKAATEDTWITLRTLQKPYFMLKLSKIRIWYYLVSLNREIRTIKVRKFVRQIRNMSELFVVRGLHVGQGRHGRHVDHVKDVAEAVLHAEVVKNPDLVLFGKFNQRNSHDNSTKIRTANS